MSNCDLTSGLNAQECRDSVGGIIEAYITNFNNVSAVTESASYVTAIVMSGGTGFETFKPNKNSSTWNQNILGDEVSNTLGFEPNLNLVFSKNEAEDINTIKLVARANTVAIVKERSGRYYLLGQDEGLVLSEGSFEAGLTMDNLNGWTVNLKGAEKDPAPEIDPTIIAALLN